MAVPWTWAFDTPFTWTKQVASHFGGTRQGMAISWPKVIKDKGGIRNQFHHVIDIVPTILEATGIQAADNGRRHHAEADRRRQHGLHLRQGERERAVDAQDAVFRDVRATTRIYHDGWIASTKVDAAALGPASARSSSDPAGYPVGALRPHQATGRSTTTSPPRIRPS